MSVNKCSEVPLPYLKKNIILGTGVLLIENGFVDEQAIYPLEMIKLTTWVIIADNDIIPSKTVLQIFRYLLKNIRSF
jgi:hypothetical protein